MIAVHDTRNPARTNHDVAFSPAQPGDDRSAKCATSIAEHLADFGVPKSKRGARNHVVLSAPSKPRTGRETAIQNLASDEWRPRYPATRRLSDRVPAATALMGYDPDRVLLEGYDAWTAGG